MMEWSQRTIDAEPDRAVWHLKSALRATRFGEYEHATAELDAVFELHPGSLGGREACYLLAVILHDEVGKRDAMRELCAVGSSMCGATDPDADVADLGSDDPEAAAR